jgi:hypothetical protein
MEMGHPAWQGGDEWALAAWDRSVNDRTVCMRMLMSYVVEAQLLF